MESALTLSAYYLIFHVFSVIMVDAEVKTVPVPGIPPPDIVFIDNPRLKSNYTLSISNKRNITSDSEREHIREHLEIPLDTKKMTEKELQFHYFKISDLDGNSMLDGTEMVKSLIHEHKNDVHHSAKVEERELEKVVDSILREDDLNHDGFLDYYEFKLAYHRKNAKAKARH